MATSMKDIKNRIKSVESTMQITKAMELVATSKLRHAKAEIEKSRPYFNLLSDTLGDIKAGLRNESCVFIKKDKPTKHCFIVIAGDRGLAGGFNQNLFKAVLSAIPDDGEVSILPIGKKVSEFFLRRNINVLKNNYEVAASVNIGDCLDMGKILYKAFESGEYDSISVFYTKFNSMLSQTPITECILPFDPPEKTERNHLTIYEPSLDGVLSHIVPIYLSGMIYGAVSESKASEYAARRTAMNNANKNAEEMIGELTLKYNRARQAAITQEITEIVAGAGEQ